MAVWSYSTLAKHAKHTASGLSSQDILDKTTTIAEVADVAPDSTASAGFSLQQSEQQTLSAASQSDTEQQPLPQTVIAIAGHDPAVLQIWNLQVIAHSFHSNHLSYMHLCIQIYIYMQC